MSEGRRVHRGAPFLMSIMRGVLVPMTREPCQSGAGRVDDGRPQGSAGSPRIFDLA
ncbi:hypothetical protein [Neomicrococcus aestuarii]|uniref:hypothetical protein n=1 Tax=Neomicrococcus aestuarii TaxID=556325 RepID=UPI001E4B7E91|nr:hypothetical protein [Neomicrococcus aestuarii]